MLLLVLLVCVVCQAKEPFCQSYQVTWETGDVNAFTVLQDREFVLLYLSVDLVDSYWQVDIDDQMFLRGRHDAVRGKTSTTKYFPDGIALVNTGKTLKLKKNVDHQFTIYTIAGYFRTICNVSDLTGDCFTNFNDLAVMANEWME